MEVITKCTQMQPDIFFWTPPKEAANGKVASRDISEYQGTFPSE